MIINFLFQKMPKTPLTRKGGTNFSARSRGERNNFFQMALKNFAMFCSQAKRQLNHSQVVVFIVKRGLKWQTFYVRRVNFVN